MPSTVPILMITVRDTTLDKVQALDLGADDYLTKPFDHLELLARMRALVRRSNIQAEAPASHFAEGDLTVDLAAQEVRVKGEEVRLTPTEYRLLEVLVRRAGAVVPHQVFLQEVWGADYVADPQYLKVFVRRLRNKLGDDPEHPRYIQTVWGTGYRFIASK